MPQVALSRGNLLNCRPITHVSVSPDDASTSFTFDLGCVLNTTPAPAETYGSEPVEQRMLHRGSDDVLQVRSDGTYQLCPYEAPPDDPPWLPLG